jgi:hypothetical protein
MRFCYCISIIVFAAYKMAAVTNNFDASIDFCHYLGPASPFFLKDFKQEIPRQLGSSLASVKAWESRSSLLPTHEPAAPVTFSLNHVTLWLLGGTDFSNSVVSFQGRFMGRSEEKDMNLQNVNF